MAEVTDPLTAGIAEAERLLVAGRTEEAARAAESVLLAAPQAGMALNVLAHAAAARGDAAAAVLLWETATRAAPALHQPWVAMGEVFFRCGETDKSIECFRQALRRAPALHPARVGLGVALQSAGRHQEAVDELRRAIAADDSSADAAVALGTSLHALGRTAQAIEALAGAARRHPHHPAILANLGVLHERSGAFEEAVAWYARALARAPDDPQTLFNRGSALVQQLRLDDARRDWERVLALRPGDAHAANNLAILELLDGNYPRGFELFEARWGVRHEKFAVGSPEWDGGPLDGKHLLLFVEQGMGDALQFCRFVPVLKRLHPRCRITLATVPALHGLLATLEGLDGVADVRPPFPPADFQLSLLSVPRALKLRLGDVPSEVPYLHPDPERTRAWRSRLGRLPAGPRVGLFWQGTQVDPNRAIRLADFAPLWSAFPGARFVSLQKGAGEEEIAAFPHPITPVGQDLLDFSDTAAALQCMDLVITIDTALAHAAGALARPTWVLLPHRPDWRWQLGRGDSPWYPTLRLFRQPLRGDWASVIAEVATSGLPTRP